VESIVSAVIAVLLLGLYAYAVFVLVRDPSAQPSEPVATIVNLVGGLVSALVVAVLAITPPSSATIRALVASQSATGWLSVVYLGVWLACGVTLVVRWIQVPAANSALVSAAKSWLGLAIAAAYASFGLPRP
jgi:hypothetical protein